MGGRRRRFGLTSSPAGRRAGPPPADVHGIVTTYQQVASNLRSGRCARSMVVLDEIHHAGDERAWGESVRRAFEVAPRRLACRARLPVGRSPSRSSATSGTSRADFSTATPARSPTADRAAVYFPASTGSWSGSPDGSAQAAAFDDPLDRPERAALRTALSLDGEWLPTVLVQADERLRALRRSHPEAGGLVIAADQDHAQGIAELLRVRCGVRATVAVSDDPMSSSRIARFATSTDPWIVAVRMVSEGVDIPRLRVGVYATTTTTELFFRQAVGRLVRWTRGVPRQKAYLFIPDDVRLRTYATQIADARRHTLRRHERDGDEPAADEAALDELRHEDDRAEQPDVPLSAVVTGEDTSSVFRPTTPPRPARPPGRDRGGGRRRRRPRARPAAAAGQHPPRRGRRQRRRARPAARARGAAGAQRQARAGHRLGDRPRARAGERAPQPPRRRPARRRGDRGAAAPPGPAGRALARQRLTAAHAGTRRTQRSQGLSRPSRR